MTRKAYREREDRPMSDRERFRAEKDLAEARTSAVEAWDRLRQQEIEREDAARAEEEERRQRRGRRARLLRRRR